jgi:6,7-dimethyl-8-ribityllumazine synthase
LTNIAIAVSEFNSEITFTMLDKARSYTQKIGANVTHILYVPGSFDMPLGVEQLLKKKNVDAVVTLGAVIKGDTRHDDIVAENTARLIADLSLKYNKPVALGVTGPGMTIEQARERAEIVPIRAISAAINMVQRLNKLKNSVDEGTVIINDTVDDN